jgi:hypothetical protein
MLHSDVDDGIINCGGELTDAAQNVHKLEGIVTLRDVLDSYGVNLTGPA